MEEHASYNKYKVKTSYIHEPEYLCCEGKEAKSPGYK